MFGLFSFSKIIVTAALIFAVWYGFKWLGNRQEIQKQAARDRVRKGGRRAARQPIDDDIEDMVQCPDCGAYVADNGRHKCG